MKPPLNRPEPGPGSRRENDQSGGYSADEAALAFGILRIAPIADQAAPPVFSRTGPSWGAIGADAVEDLTESLTEEELVTAQVKLPIEATMTVTLPAASAPPPPTTAVPRPLSAAGRGNTSWGLVIGGSVAVLMGLCAALLSGPRSGLSETWREHVLTQAVSALREGRREQAIGLLARYQDRDPDHAVEVLIRVLKKDQGHLPLH